MQASSGYYALPSRHQTGNALQKFVLDWIGLSSVLRPSQHSIGYIGDGIYRSKDPTNSIKVLKVHMCTEKSKRQ